VSFGPQIADAPAHPPTTTGAPATSSSGSASGLNHRWLLLIPVSFLLLIVVSSLLRRPLRWKASPDSVALSLLIIADASSFWSANNPSGFTIRSFSTEGGEKHDQAATDIQIGGVKAIVESAVVAIGASVLTGSYLPWASQAAYLAVDWLYFDWALRNPHDGPGIAQQAA
jgi:hypothetical protein